MVLTLRPLETKGPSIGGTDSLRTVYGPVPSRRLGRSLGVSPIPRKTCTYSCVYCQLGRTSTLTTQRRSFFPKEDVVGEIASSLPDSGAEYITFAGDGEPTLCKDLGWLVGQCKAQFGIPVAVITNGSLLDRPQVRADLMEADVVMPSLDAGSAALFRRINRPHKSVTYDKVLEGLVAFRREYHGRLWVEVMLVRGLNDSPESLDDLKHALDRVAPDQVHLTMPIRPPAEKWVQMPAPSSVHAARDILGRGHEVVGYESGTFGTSAPARPEEAIMEICLRHPLREEQAEQIAQRLGAPDVVASLVAAGELMRVAHAGKHYLIASGPSGAPLSHPQDEEPSV